MLIVCLVVIVLYNGFDVGVVLMNWMLLDYVGGLVMFYVFDIWFVCE